MKIVSLCFLWCKLASGLLQSSVYSSAQVIGNICLKHNKDVKGHSYSLVCVKMNLVKETMIVIVGVIIILMLS